MQTPQRRRQHSLKQLPTLKQAHSVITHPKLLPTISQNREQKRSTNKQLTHVVSRFNYIFSQPEMKHEEELARSAVAVLRAFASIDNNFKDLFRDLHEVVRKFVFVIDDSQIDGLLAEYRVKNGFTFRKTCLLIEAELQNVMRDKTEALNKAVSELSVLKAESQTAKANWQQQRAHLLAQTDRYRQLADVEYMESLECKVEVMKQKIDSMDLQINRLYKNTDDLNKQLEGKQKLLSDQVFQIAELKSRIHDQKSKIGENQDCFHQLRDRFDELLVKLLGMKEVIEKVEAENSILLTENAKLVSRAAVAFQDLTPRPKYHSIFGAGLKGSLKSTQDIFALVLGSSHLSPKQIAGKMTAERSKNQKLQEVQQMRGKVVDDIIEAKLDLKKSQRQSPRLDDADADIY